MIAKAVMGINLYQFDLNVGFERLNYSMNKVRTQWDNPLVSSSPSHDRDGIISPANVKR